MQIIWVFGILDCAVGSFFQKILVDQMLLFTQYQLFRKAPFWNNCVLVVKRCAIFFEQTSGLVPFKLKQTPTWITCTKKLPRILHCDIYCSWKQVPPAFLVTHRYPVFIYVLVWRISTSYWSIKFLYKIRHICKNFFLFFSILYFSLLNCFRNKTISRYFDLSILPSHNSLFLTLTGPIYNLKIPSILIQNFFLAWNENFFQAIWSQSAYNRDFSERKLINQLKWV